MFLQGSLCPGGSLSKRSLSREGLHPGGLCTGKSLSRESLSREGLCPGVSMSRRASVGRPPTVDERTVRILLECGLVFIVTCYLKKWNTTSYIENLYLSLTIIVGFQIEAGFNTKKLLLMSGLYQTRLVSYHPHKSLFLKKRVYLNICYVFYQSVFLTRVSIFWISKIYFWDRFW